MIAKGWRCEKGPRFLLIPYIRKFLSENADSDIRIYIGTDSQNLRYRKMTGYVTAIAFHIGTIDDNIFCGRGVHVIYKEKKLKRVTDNFLRLWKEANLTLEVSEFLRSNGILINCVDLDFNKKEINSKSGFKSCRLIAGAEGMFKGLGYEVSSKPDELFATVAADSLIHKINWKNVQIS